MQEVAISNVDPVSTLLAIEAELYVKVTMMHLLVNPNYRHRYLSRSKSGYFTGDGHTLVVSRSAAGPYSGGRSACGVEDRGQYLSCNTGKQQSASGSSEDKVFDSGLRGLSGDLLVSGDRAVIFGRSYSFMTPQLFGNRNNATMLDWV